MSALQVDRDFLVGTLRELVRINSINPSLAPGGAGEAEIAAYVAGALRRIGMEVTTHETAPRRLSVVGRLQGRGGGKSLMLNAHTDTAGVEGMPQPFAAEVRDGKMRGRGAYDMKGSLAASIAAVKALADGGAQLSGDVLLAAAADEEYASMGTAQVIRHHKVDAAIVAEPTEMNVCIAHKGFVWIEIETTGRAAHGSRFDEGIDANMRMGRVLAELEKLERDLRSRKGHFLLGPPSLHAATIRGGTELSMYSARCTLQIERRTVPGESEAQVLSEINTIVDRLSAADSSFNAVVSTLLVRDPFSVQPEAEIVQTITRAAADVLGHVPDLIGLPFWMDAALLSAAGVPTVVMGPVGAGAHSKDEWVDIQSAVDLAAVLAQTAVDYCQ